MFRTKVIAAFAPLYSTFSCNQGLVCENVTPYPDLTALPGWAKGRKKGKGGTLKEEEEVLVASSTKETYVWFLGRNQLLLWVKQRMQRGSLNKRECVACINIPWVNKHACIFTQVMCVRSNKYLKLCFHKCNQLPNQDKYVMAEDLFACSSIVIFFHLKYNNNNFRKLLALYLCLVSLSIWKNIWKKVRVNFLAFSCKAKICSTTSRIIVNISSYYFWGGGWVILKNVVKDNVSRF